MELRPRSDEKIRQLLQKGVDIPNPLTLDVGDEVRIDQISSEGVRIYPGCRIYGAKTVISAGCRLGYEAPATIENCQIGAGVELKGGFFSHSVFLEKANMGMGAHVREGCILEEEANGAHCVGLKQTILFPFVTLGSLINFCDCLMAGGTSRQNHSEVGSSYIHFNFTPDADKTTPSLIGDVPRGVMLNQPPIFLGGQGGIVGPVRLGYGNVVAAGSILRTDYPRDNQLIFAPAPAGSVRDFTPAAYPDMRRIIENNILYLANLKALEVWYARVRKAFFDAAEFGPLLYNGAMDQLVLAGKERLKRLKAMAQKAAAPVSTDRKPAATRTAFHEHLTSIEGVFGGNESNDETRRSCDAFLEDFQRAAGSDRTNYIETIRHLPPEVAAKGVAWLKNLADDCCERVATAAPSLNLFKK
ncbi:MAG: UDP-N-acetylglucosamine pyrophosphorylase [Syntrophus sp. (in: bacteria)]|nr:UDP-N-acetylglucosamine pyrophosphorylase [Syntrophus sp. (in: bacteria)]